VEAEKDTSGRRIDPQHLQLLRETQICKMLGISHATWWRWVKANPQVLKPIRLGRSTTRWRMTAVQAFVESGERSNAERSWPLSSAAA